MQELKKFKIEKLNEQEEILQILHRNWFYLAEQFFLLAVFCLFIFGGFFAIPYLFPAYAQAPWDKLWLFIESLFFLIGWVYAYLIWIDYYFDIWIITTERIINIEQKGMFVRSVSELSFEKVQDVTAQVSGFLPTMFNFGDVFVQTAGETERFIFRTISDPSRIKAMIMQQIEKSGGRSENAL